MESFLAGRTAISKSSQPGAVASPGVERAAALPSTAAAGASAMNLDAFESLFSVPTSSAPANNASLAHSHGAGSEPRVEIVRGEDGAVRQVIVTCICGERIHLDCDY